MVILFSIVSSLLILIINSLALKIINNLWISSIILLISLLYNSVIDTSPVIVLIIEIPMNISCLNVSI